VRVYGGPTAQTVMDGWEVTADLRAQYLARHGYVVFRLDNPRHAPPRQAFETALAGHLGSVEVEDQVAGARYLAGLPYVDGKAPRDLRLSYGGYMAARCCCSRPSCSGPRWRGPRSPTGTATIRINGALHGPAAGQSGGLSRELPPPSRITPLGRLLIVGTA